MTRVKMTDKDLLIGRKATVFVGGPIQYAINGSGPFSAYIRTIIEHIIKALRKDGFNVISAHEFEKFGEIDVRNKFNEVSKRDYTWMLECDLFLAILPLGPDGEPVHTSGTAIELGWASMLSKPVVIVRDPAPKYSHLVAGLGAVTQLEQLDINHGEIGVLACGIINRLLGFAPENGECLADSREIGDASEGEEIAPIVEEAELKGVWPNYGPTEIEGLKRVLQSKKWCRLKDDDWRTGECGLFEREFGEYLDSEHVITVASGTVALELGLSALGVRQEDEILVQAGTFFGTVTPMLKLGAIPVFADINPHTLTVDPESLKSRLTEKTVGVVVVPLCGFPADMDRLLSFCATHELWLLEDCAQAIGTKWKGKMLGTFGDIGTFSFQQDKPLQSGEGGAVVCKNKNLLGRVFAYHHGFGVNGAPQFDRHLPGTNSRITPWQASILRNQLAKLDGLIDKRYKNYRRLCDLLRPSDPIRPVPCLEQTDRLSLYSAPFLFDKDKWQGGNRDTFLASLKSMGVPATEGHIEPLYLRPLFKENNLPHRNTDCPVTEHAARETYLSIMHWFFLGPSRWTDRLLYWMRQPFRVGLNR